MIGITRRIAIHPVCAVVWPSCRLHSTTNANFSPLYSAQATSRSSRGETEVGKSITSQMFGNFLRKPPAVANATPFSEKSIHPFKIMFPWRTIEEFSAHLVSSICHNDGKLICLVKPWGVGTHLAWDRNMSRTNPDALYSRVLGSPKFCLDDALPFLRAHLMIPDLRLIRSCDRYMSGIILYAADDETRDGVIAALRRTFNSNHMIQRYFVVTKGIPAIKGPDVVDRLAMRIEEVKNTSDLEPVLMPISQCTGNDIRLKRVHLFSANMRVLQSNRKDAVALVEVAVKRNIKEFVRCYVAHKASFILGDVRFSNRVRTVLGANMRISPLSAVNMKNRENFEPLTENLCKKLSISGNAQIPLHLHLNEYRMVGGYELKSNRKSPESQEERKDLVISANELPPHFEWTLKRLNLIPSEDIYASQETVDIVTKKETL